MGISIFWDHNINERQPYCIAHTGVHMGYKFKLVLITSWPCVWIVIITDNLAYCPYIDNLKPSTMDDELPSVFPTSSLSGTCTCCFGFFFIVQLIFLNYNQNCHCTHKNDGIIYVQYFCLGSMQYLCTLVRVKILLSQDQSVVSVRYVKSIIRTHINIRPCAN